MTEPLVCAVLLTRDRPAMAARAVAAFRAQTYPESHRALFILDSSPKMTLGLPYGERLATSVWVPDQDGETIGELRNGALRAALGWLTFDVVVTWDDDDLSHPNRIAEQVALLQASGKECVGYRECLFWQTRIMVDDRAMPDAYGEAWLYQNADPRRALGASLCYWRRVWEQRPFPDMPKGRNATAEDTEWLKGVNSLGVSGARCKYPPARELPSISEYPAPCEQPRLICSIHGGNSTDYDPAGLMAHGSPNWQRAPEWDDYCRGRMAL